MKFKLFPWQRRRVKPPLEPIFVRADLVTRRIEETSVRLGLKVNELRTFYESGDGYR